MQAVLLSDSDKERYDKFITEYGGSFLQSWEWGDFQAINGHKVIRYGMEEGGKILLTAQLAEYRIPHLPGKYLYCGYGPVGNSEFLPKLTDFIRKNSPQDIWFVKFEPKESFNLAGTVSHRIQPGVTLVTDLSQTEDNLLKEMHHKTRYNIRLAEKHGVEIEKIIDPNEEQVAEIVELLTATSSRHKYSDHPSSYYRNLLTTKPEQNLKIATFWAKHEGDILALAITVDSGQTRTYLFGASSEIKKNLMAPHLLHWRAMLDAKDSGIKYYDWWGLETSSGKTAGFSDFKKRFGGQTVKYPSAVDIILNRPWYTVYKVLRTSKRIF